MNFILFNGPPRSGKDTAAQFACEFINGETKFKANWEKFSYPLKAAFAGIMEADMDPEGNVEYYEEHKGDPVVPFGISFRQFQIDMSEKFLKPVYGQDIFGRLLLERCKPRGGPEIINVVSDCGFQIEVDTLKDHNVLLIRLCRDGCDFAKDSRNYVQISSGAGWTMEDHYNNGSLDDLKEAIEESVEEWIKSL